jgi:hypothetical protein
MATVRRVDLPAEGFGQVLLIQELGGSAPIRIEMRGSFGVERGAEWDSDLRGEVRTPLGASSGYAGASGRTWGKTEMVMPLDAAFLRRDDLRVENAEVPTTPEEVLLLLQRLQDRARSCLVQLGVFSRRGVLRSAKATPEGGYSVNFGSRQPGPPGVNLTLRLTWEWVGKGEPGPAPEPPATGADVAGQLGAADSAYGLALADMSEAFSPDALATLSGGIGRIRGQISALRRTVQQIGALANAPARLANEALAAARSLGNVVNDLEQQIGDTRDAYLALGKAAESTRRALGPRPSALARAGRARGSLRDANQLAMGACAAVFDAIARRQRRRAAVRPGQSLADVARVELGSADRWREIAELNDIAGQVVPPGRTAVDLPEGA